MKKNKPTREQLTQFKVNRRLGPLIKFVHAKRGNLTLVVKKLNRRTSDPWLRQEVENWLREDPKKRREPLLGVGLVLLDLSEKLLRRNGHANKSR